ncbi:MAG: hypothetical protein F6K28_18430 [Microcoleus sp. SIO2G3]|nr:hypothetical protein [Microcoleus sp. SIO2G3]
MNEVEKVRGKCDRVLLLLQVNTTATISVRITDDNPAALTSANASQYKH